MKINLIPQEKSTEIKEGKSNFVATAVAIVIVVGVIGTYLILKTMNLTKSKENNDYKTRIKDLKEALNQSEYQDVEKKMLTVQSGVSIIEEKSGAQFKWNRTFQEFSKTLPDYVVLQSYKSEGNAIEVSCLIPNKNTLTTTEDKRVDVMIKFIQSLRTWKTDIMIYPPKEDGSRDKANLFVNIENEGYTKGQDSLEFTFKFEAAGGILWK